MLAHNQWELKFRNKKNSLNIANMPNLYPVEQVGNVLKNKVQKCYEMKYNRKMKIKIYVLGMKHNFRGEELINSIKKSSIDFEICWGIEANDVNSIANFRDENKSIFLYGRKLTTSEISCTLGHRNILFKALADGVDCAIILEDDVMINNFEWVKSKALKFANSQIPTLTLLIADHRLCLTSNSIAKNRSVPRELKILSNPSPSSAYLLNSSALESLRNLPESHWCGVQADFPPIYSELLCLIDASESIVPAPIILLNIESTIQNNIQINQGYNWFKTRSFRKIISFKFYSKSEFNFSMKTLIFHFIGRSLAWRLRHDRMPTRGIDNN